MARGAVGICKENPWWPGTQSRLPAGLMGICNSGPLAARMNAGAGTDLQRCSPERQVWAGTFSPRCILTGVHSSESKAAGRFDTLRVTELLTGQEHSFHKQGRVTGDEEQRVYGTRKQSG